MKSSGKLIGQLGCALGVWLAFTASASAESIIGVNFVHVDPRSNIFSAGQTAASAPGGGGAGVLPVPIPIDPLPVLAEPPSSPMQRVLTFPQLEGELSASGLRFNSLDGGTDFGGMTHLNGANGIAGIMHADRNMFLTGVFLGDTPTTGPAPEALSFRSSDDFSELRPELGQPFFIGDGKNMAGDAQRFFVPNAATRLFLGVADGLNFNGDPGYYDDNQGGVDLNYQVTAVAVPEPATFFAWCAALGAAAAWGIRRRKTMRLA